jgi:hypothetical protein
MAGIGDEDAIKRDDRNVDVGAFSAHAMTHKIAT